MKGFYKFSLLVLSVGCCCLLHLPASSLAKCLMQSGKIGVDNVASNLVLGPLVYQYGPSGAAEFRYPETGDRCIYRHDGRWLHFACPGSSIDYHIGSKFLRSEASTSYLYYKDNPYGLRIHNHSFDDVHFQSDCYPVCRLAPEPLMIDVSRGQRRNFSVGYYVNALDFLEVLRVRRHLGNDLSVAATIVPALAEAPRLPHPPKFQRGAIFAETKIKFSEIYSLDYQRKIFKNVWTNDTVMDQYLNENNHLVMTQMISDDDLYYMTQQKAAYYYENTLPMWLSIARGNWRLISRLIRELADSTDRPLRVKVTPTGALRMNGSRRGEPVMMGRSLASSETLVVPQTVDKYVIDPGLPQRRSLVYRVLNDPWPSEDEIARAHEGCDLVEECQLRQPLFKDRARGYVICCRVDMADLEILPD
ncbi:hypothetical protein TKK_0003171 [Trichogramma kaykai]|uniref:Uncharacterized protein n=1 Tax=Trichogramma kaykai TaxID=54128 RepID=A0ABD2WST1_9HYME